MSRAPELEAILQAWFDLESCAPAEHEERKQRLDELLDISIAKVSRRSISRRELMMALREQYREFAKAKETELRQRLSRLK